MKPALLTLVDALDFRALFIDELGWHNPDRAPFRAQVEQKSYELNQVAGYKGLRIWWCDACPPRPVQRTIDTYLGKENAERLVIFTSGRRQEWRWPRRAQLGSANAKLLAHEHIANQPDPDLLRRLETIRLDFDEDISLVQLLGKMREAFDAESESASVLAARLMGTLYADLEGAHIPPLDATLLLARLLFVFFGDDADMWDTRMFHDFVQTATTPETFHADLTGLFDVLDTPPERRGLSPTDPQRGFRYINGELYSRPLRLPPLPATFRAAVLAACDFDWAIISPAIFGAMFQTVKSREARRAGGEHYTTERNILKTIRPLFLDGYFDRFEASPSDKAQLTRLHNDIGRLRFLDPACGCGNFLIVAYRELRSLELEILKARRDLDLDTGSSGVVSRSQLSMDVSGEIKVRLDHFYGIEVEEWPARIAETAMLLVDHLANLRMAQEFGKAPDRLPISIAPSIRHSNALRIRWSEVLPPNDDVIVLGNPPFRGDRNMSAEQKDDLRAAWDGRQTGHLDLVTGWFAQAMSFFREYDGRWAFVATSSTCQGEPVAELWQPILDRGWRCRFAHRSFEWDSDAEGVAGVHVSIVGFDRRRAAPKPRLWIYPFGGVDDPTEHVAASINPYLIDGPNVLVQKNTNRPLHDLLPPVAFGNMPRDGGNLIVEREDYPEVSADPIARKYLRKYVGAEELLNGQERWCLWMTELDPQDLQRSEILQRRVDGVRDMRLASKAASTRGMAATPHLFAQRTQPNGDCLVIPGVVSERRHYFTVARFHDGVKASNAAFTAADPDGYVLGVLSSKMFIAWMRAVGGRLKSDPRFSKNLTYNGFPMPVPEAATRGAIVAAARGVEAARAEHPRAALAALYAPGAMPQRLQAAHDELDESIEQAFGTRAADDEYERQKLLFRCYRERREQTLS